MTRPPEIIIDPRIIPEAAAIAGSKAELFAAMKWASDALTPGDLRRLGTMLEGDDWRLAIREMVDGRRAFRTAAGCDD